MADETAASGPEGETPVRDEEGGLSGSFVEAIRNAIAAGDAEASRRLVGVLHEADLGDLLEALEPEERTALIRLLGDEFDFTALTELDDAVRVQILEELPPETVAEGVRELDSDDAVSILEDLEPEEQSEILAQLPPVEQAVLARPEVQAMISAAFDEAVRPGPDGVVDDTMALYGLPWGFDPAAIATPTYLWHGELDTLVPVTHSRWLADRIPGSILVTRPDAGHTGHFDATPVMLDWLLTAS